MIIVRLCWTYAWSYLGGWFRPEVLQRHGWIASCWGKGIIHMRFHLGPKSISCTVSTIIIANWLGELVFWKVHVQCLSCRSLLYFPCLLGFLTSISLVINCSYTLFCTYVAVVLMTLLFFRVILNRLILVGCLYIPVHPNTKWILNLSPRIQRYFWPANRNYQF